MPTHKKLSNFRLPEEVKDMLERLAAYRGGSQAVIVEQLIREAFHKDEEAMERAEKKKGQTVKKTVVLKTHRIHKDDYAEFARVLADDLDVKVKTKLVQPRGAEHVEVVGCELTFDPKAEEDVMRVWQGFRFEPE